MLDVVMNYGSVMEDEYIMMYRLLLPLSEADRKTAMQKATNNYYRYSNSETSEHYLRAWYIISWVLRDIKDNVCRSESLASELAASGTTFSPRKI